MIWRRKVVLHLNRNDALSKLAKVSGTQKPTSETPPGEFKFFKSVASLYNHRCFIFCFSGRITEENSGVLLEYTVSPTLSVHIATIAFCITLIMGIRSLFIGTGSIPFVMVGLFINVLFWLWVSAEAHTCMADFEKRFQIDS